MNRILLCCMLFLSVASGLLADNDWGQEYFAATVEEFLASIGPNRTIVLTAGDYLIPDTQVAETSYYTLNSEIDGFYANLVIKNVNQLQIVKRSGAPAHIHSSENISSEVIRFHNCSGIRLANLNMGHDYSGDCIGPVLYVNKCNDIEFENVRMYGCGSHGVKFNLVNSAILKYCEITDCSYGLVEMYSCKDIVYISCNFNNCSFDYNIEWGGAVMADDSTRIGFRDCIFRDITYEYLRVPFRFVKSDGTLQNCQVDGELRNEVIGPLDSYLQPEAVRYLKNVNYRDYDAELGKQVYYGNFHIVELLLERDANPNYVYPDTGCSVLQQALYWGNTRIVNSLLSKGADCLYTDPQGRNAAFYLARVWGNKTELTNKILDMVEYDLTASNGLSVGSYAGIYGNSWLYYDLNQKFSAYDLNDDQGRTPFFYAVANHRMEILKWNYGKWKNFPTDVDEDGNGLMMYAIASGDTAIVEFFTGMKGAMEQVDKRGNGVLLYSIFGNDAYRELDLVSMQQRLEYPARIYDEYDEPFQPAQSVPKKNYNAIIRLLISKGANVNQRREDGLSPLTAAVWMNDYETAKILLDNGASPYFKYQGKVPLDIAKENKVDARIIELLTRAMER